MYFNNSWLISKMFFGPQSNTANTVICLSIDSSMQRYYMQLQSSGSGKKFSSAVFVGNNRKDSKTARQQDILDICICLVHEQCNVAGRI